MIPMGTVVTVCMLQTALFANRFPHGALNEASPRWLLRLAGSIAAAAGLWNILWYGLRHAREFWGLMAFGSGLVMLSLSLLLLLPRNNTPRILIALRPWLVVAMLIFCAYYGWTIYKL